MENQNNRNFKVLNDREHCLLRPSMYIGGVDLTDSEQWIFNKETSKFEYGTVRVVPALLKCASELIDNSIDVAIDTNFKYATKIQVNVDDKPIEVIDNGIGIPCVPPAGSTDTSPAGTCACLAWTKLKAGTSFDDSRTKIGTNGVGSSCVNVFSKRFIGKSDDGKHAQTIDCSDNMSKVSASKVRKSSGRSGVSVYCEPDLPRFGVDKIDDAHKGLIYQRLVNLAICFPKIKFVFNGETVKMNEKSFAKMFSENAIITSSDNTTLVVFPNEHDEFKFYSCVNGLDTVRGGTHVSYMATEICSRVRDKLVKKYKSLRPGDVKNKLCIAVLMTGFVNPKFDSQTKESLTNSTAEVTAHLAGKIDFDAFAKAILKNEAIIGPVVETFKIKEELKARQELKSAKKVKVRSEKYMAPMGGTGSKYLFLCEGQSAQSSICSCLGRNGNGYYSLRGLPINVLDNSIQKIAANQEFKDVMNILGLDTASDSPNKTIDFEKVVIACDQDLDGNHLSSMLIGWFRKFAPNLFDEGRVCKLQTPLIIVKDAKEAIKEYFFDLDSFKKWENGSGGKDRKLKIYYQKGLGSIERADMKWLMTQNGGMEQFLYELRRDEKAFEAVDLWLAGDADSRKDRLRKYTLDIDMI